MTAHLRPQRRPVPPASNSASTLTRPALGELPDALREELIGAINEVERNYREGRWEPAELNGGKLCEVVYPDGVRLLQVGDIGRGRLRMKSRRYVTADRARELNCTLLEPGDILISRMADPIGRACILPAPSLQAPFRWRDWAAPDGPKRRELTDAPMGSFLGFVNGDLLPYLRGLRDRPSAGRARRSSARSSRQSRRSASTRSGTCSTSSIGSTTSARRRWTRPTSSRSARPTRACC